MTKRKKIS